MTASTGEPLLSLRGLRVAYGPIEAVHGIDVEVFPGEIVCILGANGAGKTSTLLAVSGVLRPKGGSIVFDGKDLGRTADHQIAGLGIAHVPEGRRVFPRMTVWENLQMGSYAAGRDPEPADIQRVFDLFAVLRDRRNQLAGTLSGGEQQMLAIGRALVSRPKLLLLDEPSMGLAPLLVKTIFDLLRSVNADGLTTLLVEQNARMALALAHRAYVMETGAIVLSGPSDELAGDPRVQTAYLGGSPAGTATALNLANLGATQE
jgi:branched-chain amino acid transport system ATP-binding protein